MLHQSKPFTFYLFNHDVIQRSDSNSDTEPRGKKLIIPLWAHTPNLNRVLDSQYTMNPDKVFGEIEKCVLEGKSLIFSVFKKMSRNHERSQ